MTGQEHTDPFRDLDWETLEEWCGARTLERGRQYQHQGRVHDLVRGADGVLIAWVDGTERYATRVTVSGDGTITSACTCPVETACKHAVAVICEYLAYRKEEKPVGNIQAGDPRLCLLQTGPEPGLVPDREILPPAPPGRKNSRSAHSGPRKNRIPLSPYLEGLSREELVRMLMDLAREYPSVEQDLRDRKAAADVDAGPVIGALLSDIKKISAGDAWSNSWNGESCIPDYSPVRKRMELLLSMGFPDAVIDAGRVLLEKGMDQVGQSDDDGETAGEVESCMDIVFRALARSSLPAHERILFAILTDLDDEYSICGGAETFWQEKFTVQDWGLVADSLLSRLAGQNFSLNSRDFHQKCVRDNLVTWIVTALDNSGRNDEATNLCFLEAEKTDSYVRLAKRLFKEGRKSEAREWIARGIRATAATSPGIAGELRAIQRGIWEKDGDRLSAAGERAGEFLEKPSFPTYRQLELSARDAGVWDDMETGVMQFLLTGKIPAGQGQGDSKKIFGVLPDTGLFPRVPDRRTRSPFFDVLLDIAIAEKRPDDVLRWYDKLREDNRTRGFHYIPYDKVADAVAGKFPERALAIWKGNAERFAAEGRPKSYESSIGYFRKIRGLMIKQGNGDEWSRYIAGIQAAHARKRKFLDMLDIFEGGKILKP